MRTLIGRVQPLAVAFQPWLRPLRHWLLARAYRAGRRDGRQEGLEHGFDLGWQAAKEGLSGPLAARKEALGRIGAGFRAGCAAAEQRPQAPHPFRRRPAT